MVSNPPDITVASATNADGEKIRQLVFGVLREYGLEPEPNGTDEDLSDIEVNYLQRGGVFEILRDADGNVLGTVGLYPINTETIELRKMYFAPELRGRGLGKQTLRRMIQRARELGYKNIYLETNSVLREAVGLYQSFGFVPTDERHSPRCNQAYVLVVSSEQ